MKNRKFLHKSKGRIYKKVLSFKISFPYPGCEMVLNTWMWDASILDYVWHNDYNKIIYLLKNDAKAIHFWT